MAWTSPPTFTVGEVAKSSDLNIMASDLAFLVGTTFASVATAQTTSSASMTDLGTVGPAVTVTTGAKALVIVTMDSFNGTANVSNYMGYAVSGATTIAAALANAARSNTGAGVTVEQTWSAVLPTAALTPGSNTFTAKYAVAGGTGTFQNRTITVIPLP